LELLTSETVNPPAGAGPLIVTVPVDEPPPFTLAGANVTFVTTGGRTDNDVDTETPLADAPIVAEAWEATGVVLIVNVAELFPAATVTDRGGDAAPLLLES
jgi:hypothetical protein